MRASLRSCGIGLLLLAISVLGLAQMAAAHSCGTSGACPATCTFNCNEQDLRDAVARLNRCTPSSPTGTILSPVGCPANKTIFMSQDSAGIDDACGSLENGICIFGNKITFDGTTTGGDVIFEYNGLGRCCSDQCDPNSPFDRTRLFTLKGNDNRVQDFTMRFFPEGIFIDRGNNHAVTRVTADRICEDAVSVIAHPAPTPNPTAAAITENHFYGRMPEDGHDCYGNDPNHPTDICGLDKTVQLNGGSALVADNHFYNARAPIKVSGGVHVVRDNTMNGSGSDESQCEALPISHLYPNSDTIKVEYRRNTLNDCKNGIQPTGGTYPIEVRAYNNTFNGSHRSAFNVQGSGSVKIKGQGNYMRLNPTPPFPSEIKAAIVNQNPDAQIDFGGGDRSNPCLDSDCSDGVNSFCQEPTFYDIRNTTSGGVGAKFNCWGDESPLEVLVNGSNIDTGSPVSCAQGGFTPCGNAPPTATRTPTPSRTHTHTYTPVGPSPTNTRTHTPAHTYTWTSTETVTRTPTITNTFTRTNTATHTPTPCATLAPCASGQSSACQPGHQGDPNDSCFCACKTNTPTRTPTATRTNTPTPCATHLPCGAGQTSVCQPGHANPPMDSCYCACATFTPTNTPTPAICPEFPATCDTPISSRHSSLSLKNESNKKALLWQWKSGEATPAEFADPDLTQAFGLCIYDKSGSGGTMHKVSEMRIPSNWVGQWTTYSSGKRKFRDRTEAPHPDGIHYVDLTPGAVKKAKIRIKGRGERQNDPVFTSGLPFPTMPLSPPVMVQLHRTGESSCWSATYSGWQRNLPTQYKATSD